MTNVHQPIGDGENARVGSYLSPTSNPSTAGDSDGTAATSVFAAKEAHGPGKWRQFSIRRSAWIMAAVLTFSAAGVSADLATSATATVTHATGTGFGRTARPGGGTSNARSGPAAAAPLERSPASPNRASP